MRRFRLTAWLWLLVGAAYFLIPLIATLLFSLKSVQTAKCCTSANYSFIVHDQAIQHKVPALGRGPQLLDPIGVYAAPRVYKWPDQPRPDRPLVIREIPCAQITEILWLIVGVTRS